MNSAGIMNENTRDLDDPLQRWVERIRAALRASHLPAASLRAFPCVAVFDDVFFENHDFDMIPPSARRRIDLALRNLGFAALSGRSYVHGDGTRACLPRPAYTLAADPAETVRTSMAADTIVFTTPTQLLLLALEREACFYDPAVGELEELLRTCPANLSKIVRNLRGDPRSPAFSQIFPRLERAQAQALARLIPSRNQDQ